MPIGNEKADLILLGGTDDDKKGIVVELKQWSNIKETESRLFYSIPGYGIEEHPSAQVLNYSGKLKMLHSIGSQYKWKSFVLMHNMDKSNETKLNNEKTGSIIQKAPIFYKEDLELFINNIKSFLISTTITEYDIEEFNNAPYEQTIPFFDLIREKAEIIGSNIIEAIADTGAGLTEEQEKINEDVVLSAKISEQKVFLIKGSPGSGKTLVAVYLLLRLLSEKYNTLLALRNNRLMAIIRKCLDEGFPGASGATIYNQTRYGSGLGDRGHKWKGDVVICDESQRFSSASIERIMNRAPVIIFFYDEGQILNPPEEGTTENFTNIATKLNKSIEHKVLSAHMRCRGGYDYHEWVDGLILSKDNKSTHCEWKNKYDFQYFNDINSMISQLKQKTEAGSKVALVASFTETKGKMNSPFHKDNLRIGYPLVSGLDIYKNSNLTIPWLMNPKSDYLPYWLEGQSNNLDRVASIYGCQGFESDYVGVVWGRDFIWRDGKWKVGDSEIITDTIDGFKSAANKNHELALKLLENRYRIFLTRGMLGTYIFCEDEETSEHLQNIISKNEISEDKFIPCGCVIHDATFQRKISCNNCGHIVNISFKEFGYSDQEFWGKLGYQCEDCKKIHESLEVEEDILICECGGNMLKVNPLVCPECGQKFFSLESGCTMFSKK